MIRALAAAIAVLLMLAPAAPAHHSPTSRTHNIRHVAASVWGPRVCGDTMTVAIIRVRLPGTIAGRAFAATQQYPCRIEVGARSWPIDALCRVIAHEYGHLAGWHARPGASYIAPGGTVDERHSRKPTSVMYPRLVAYFPPCRRDRIRAATRTRMNGGSP